MPIYTASFFWRNNEPGGIGITFGPPGLSPEDLSAMFEGHISKAFMRDSDKSLGSNIVGHMLGQLTHIGEIKQRGEPISNQLAILAALNIMWLSSRGFIPNDEFNGVQFITELYSNKPKGKT